MTVANPGWVWCAAVPDATVQATEEVDIIYFFKQNQRNIYSLPDFYLIFYKLTSCEWKYTKRFHVSTGV